MNLPIKQSSLTINSYEFLRDFINKARSEFDESPIRHNDFIAKIKDEIDDNLSYEKIVAGNHPIDVIILNEEQMILMGMRESKAVRKSVLSKLHQLESKQNPQIPQTYAEALQLAADQAKQLELAAPKVAFFDNLVERDSLMTATQVAQKHHKSAIWLNKILSELGVYNNAVKRARVFKQDFIDKGYGEMKQTEQGYSQCLFTTSGESWINEKLISEGII